MWAFLKNEWKSGFKGLVLWSLSVGALGLFCILLYKSMEPEMEEMAKSMAVLGKFADAFGMSTLSIATLKGFFATEVGTVHALGGSLFAASVATCILSKEEDGHTADFTMTLPLSRTKIIVVKFITVILEVLAFTFICGLMYELGFVILKDNTMGKDFLQYMVLQFIMNIQVASICLLISAVSRKNKLGMGIAVAMVLYAMDMMIRVVPKLESWKVISPFSYSNATDLFAGLKRSPAALFIALVCILFLGGMAFYNYKRKDLVS